MRIRLEGHSGPGCVAYFNSMTKERIIDIPENDDYPPEDQCQDCGAMGSIDPDTGLCQECLGY
jgi:hypothetical protein